MTPALAATAEGPGAGRLWARPGPLRALARRAFRDPAAAPEVRYRWRGGWRTEPPAVLPAGAPAAARTAVIVPTLAPAEGLGSLPAALGRLAVSLERAREEAATGPEGPPAFFLAIAMQDRPGGGGGQGEARKSVRVERQGPGDGGGAERRGEGKDAGRSGPGDGRRGACLEEVERLWGRLSAVPVVGVAVSVPGKLLALNSCIPLLDANRAARLLWFDDDVEVEPGCVARLLAAYDPASPGVYGARKVAVVDRSPFSAWWAGRKNRKEPVNLYPHGCAVLLSRAGFGDGIPLAYITDDHYLLFRFLDPAAADPLHALRVVREAVVRVPTVNTPAVFLGRVARNYRNLQRVLADASPEVARCFLRLHFTGLRPPRSAAEAASPRYWRRLAADLLRRLFWAACKAEVLARGLLRRPRGAVWYSAPLPHVLREESGRR